MVKNLIQFYKFDPVFLCKDWFRFSTSLICIVGKNIQFESNILPSFILDANKITWMDWLVSILPDFCMAAQIKKFKVDFCIQKSAWKYFFFYSTFLPDFSLCQDRLSHDASELGKALLCSSSGMWLYPETLHTIHQTS